MHKPQSKHLKQLGIEIARALSIIFREDYESQMGIISVLEVRLSKDQSIANVYCTFFKDDKAQVLVKTLNKEAKRLRMMVAHRIQTRHTPELRFFADETEATARRIDALLGGEGNKNSKA